MFTHPQLSISRMIHLIVIPLVLPAYGTDVGVYFNRILANAVTSIGVSAIDAAVVSILLFAFLFLALLFVFGLGFACYSPIIMYQAKYSS
jgi:hypothetical protein